MNIELIGALDYSKVKKVLSKTIDDDKKINYIIKKIKDIEKARRSEIVSSAGRLSRFPGDAKEVLELSESKTNETNNKFISRVIGLGHKSISDHDYLVFTIKNVSAIIEQIIIEERIASFTIKSRREVNFSKAGYYTPNFHNKNGNLLENNIDLKKQYKKHINTLFKAYNRLIDNNIKQEDARFILPYCFYSNIIMGVDAHTLIDMIIKFTKTKYSNITECKLFGEKLYKIAKDNIPYVTSLIDKVTVKTNDSISELLDQKLKKEKYKIVDKVTMTGHSTNIDSQILISAIMRRYQYSYNKAKKIYAELCEKDKDFKFELMKKIAFEGDKLELSQVNFQFQIPVSYAILTHFTRHRTHKIIVPDFVPNVDLSQYKIPPKIKDDNLIFYKNIFNENKKMYELFKSKNVRDEDLIYFTLSGNMTNVLTNMDGWTIRHILELRECTKAQWETREISNAIHKEIEKIKDTEAFCSVLGPTCVTQKICNEGKESCGRIKTLI